VGDRLLSAVVPYEETGWYDGQLYVKPPEVCVLTLAMACASAPFLEANALCHISSLDDVCDCPYIDIGFSLSSLTFSQFRTWEICLAFSSFVVLSPGLCDWQILARDRLLGAYQVRYILSPPLPHLLLKMTRDSSFHGGVFLVFPDASRYG
jgi:hypothetical protein